MKKYPNNTMMGELQQRLLQLRKFPLPAPIVKQKISDLEKMLLIADLQRKLQHQRSVPASLPSSSTMKSLVKKTEAQLAAAVLLAPAVEHVPAPAQEAVQDGDRDALPQLAKAVHYPLRSTAQKVGKGELQTQVDALQYQMEQVQSKVDELIKKRHVGRVSVQHLATGNYVPIPQRFKKEILMDRVKLMDFVQFAFKKEKYEDAPIEGTATEGFEKKETDVQVVQEHTDVIVENVDTAHEDQDEHDPIVSETSLQVDLDNKTSPVDKSGEANNDDEVKSEDEEDPDEEIPDKEIPDEETPDEEIPNEETLNEDINEEEEIVEEGKSAENHPKKKWTKILRMKILQVMRRRLKKSSDFLSNQNPPGKSGCGPSIPIFPASSHAATDIRKSDQLRKFSFARQNPQQLSTCVSVGECSDQLHEGKLFNAEEFFQKFSDQKDGGDQYEREVIVRNLAAKKPFTKTSLDPTRGTEYVIYLIK